MWAPTGKGNQSGTYLCEVLNRYPGLMGTEREMTDGGSQASLFERFQSLADGLIEFYPTVETAEHVCDEPEACCEGALITFPVCSFLAFTVRLMSIARASKEESERLETMSDEHWFDVGIRAMEAWVSQDNANT